jgi:hypothetical protein
MEAQRLLLTTALAAALLSPPTRAGDAKAIERPLGSAIRLKEVRTQRFRVPADFINQKPVRFESTHVEMDGTIRADGHNLQLYGVRPIFNSAIC